MHASTEQLLDLRDGEAVDAATQQHINGCVSCRAQLKELGQMRQALNGLPTLMAPPAVWSAAQGRLDGGSHRRHWLAAAVTLLVGLLVWQGVRMDLRQEINVKVPAPTATDQVPALVARSRQLEGLLRQLDQAAPRAMSAGTGGTIAQLQDSIALIDQGLSYGEDVSQSASQQLWQQRVVLMDTLVQLRGSQAQTLASTYEF